MTLFFRKKAILNTSPIFAKEATRWPKIEKFLIPAICSKEENEAYGLTLWQKNFQKPYPFVSQPKPLAPDPDSDASSQSQKVEAANIGSEAASLGTELRFWRETYIQARRSLRQFVNKQSGKSDVQDIIRDVLLQRGAMLWR